MVGIFSLYMALRLKKSSLNKFNPVKITDKNDVSTDLWAF